MSRVPRKPSTVPAPHRGRLRRVKDRKKALGAEERAAVRAAIADDVTEAAIARELGVTKQVLHARRKSWGDLD